MTLDRKRQEVALLRKQYTGVEHGPNLDWVVVRGLLLPPLWNRSATDVLVLIPPGYPATPPDNFYVPDGLRSTDEKPPSSYSEGQNTPLGGGWAQFSFHAKSWEPGETADGGDNLVTYLVMAERRLGEGV